MAEVQTWHQNPIEAIEVGLAGFLVLKGPDLLRNWYNRVRMYTTYSDQESGNILRIQQSSISKMAG